jgi:hypothetical protein
MSLAFLLLTKHMSTKQKLINIVAAQPRLVTFGIGLAVSFGIAVMIGISEAQQAHAVFDTLIGRSCNGC